MVQDTCSLCAGGFCLLNAQTVRECSPCIVATCCDTCIPCPGCTIVNGKLSSVCKGTFLDLDNCHVSCFGSFLGGACVQLAGGSGSLRHCTFQVTATDVPCCAVAMSPSHQICCHAHMLSSPGCVGPPHHVRVLCHDLGGQSS
jgi:hypothetical protein